MSTTPNLGQTTWDPGNTQPDLLYNSLLSVMDALVPTPVVTDKDLTAPPGSPVPGSLYIVASPATGLWVGRENNLVVYTYANAWMFILPKPDWLVFVADEAEGYRFNGSDWVVDSSGGGGFSNPMTTAGDLIVGGTAGAAQRLAKGTDGTVLTMTAGVQSWAYPLQSIVAAASDEATALTTGTAKVTFRNPFASAFVITHVKASLTVAQTSGSIFTVDLNEAGTSILSTKITIDNTKKTSETAATAPVVSDTSLAADAEITVDIDQIGDGTAKGLKVYLIGHL